MHASLVRRMQPDHSLSENKFNRSGSSILRHRQFVLFLIVGGAAALVNFGSRIALSHWLSFSAAIVVAYLAGMITAFALNRAIVFRAPQNELQHQIFWFIAVNIAAVLQTLLVSLLLTHIVFPRVGFSWHAEAVAHAIGVAVPVVTSFMGHKALTFKGA